MATFTQNEISFLEKNPEAIRAVAMYHELQILHADSIGMQSGDSERRQQELLDEAARIEADC